MTGKPAGKPGDPDAVDRAVEQEVRVGPWIVFVTRRRLEDLGRKVGALVSSDDGYLSHGGGVSRALWERAGPELEATVPSHIRSLSVGEVVDTPAFLLDADHLLHAVTVDFDRGERLDEAHAPALYGRVLDRALALGCASMGLPLLGTGSARLENAASVTSFAEALDARRADGVGLEVYLTVPHPDAYAAAMQVLPTRGREHVTLRELVDRVADRLSPRQAEQVRTIAGLRAVPATSDEAIRAARAFEAMLAFASEQVAGPRDGPASQLSVIQAALGSEPEARALLVACRAALNASDRVIRRDLSSEQRLAATRALDDAMTALLRYLADSPVFLTTPSETLPTTERYFPFAPHERLGRLSLRGSVRGDEPLDSAAAVGSLVAWPDGTSAVRSLHELLLTACEQDLRAELVERLRASGYEGGDDLCLLEYCAEASPVDVLRDVFSGSQMRRVLRGHGVDVPHHATPTDVAMRLAEVLGFRVPRRVLGVRDVRQRIARASNAHALGSGELAVEATAITTGMESILRTYLTFFVRTYFGASPQRWAQDQGLLSGGKTVDRASLGLLVAMLDHVKVAAEREPDQAAIAHVRERAGDPVELPTDDCRRLAELRNTLVHDVSLLEVDELRRHVVELCEVAASVLDALEAQHVHPRLVTVRRVVTDQWGRRTVQAEGEDGNDVRIFTDEDLQPGMRYLMRSRTNPLCVDPILVVHGDLLAGDG